MRTARYAVAAALGVGVLVVAAGHLVDPGPAPSSPAAAAVPGLPAGRFEPTWMPAGLRIASEIEETAPLTAARAGSSRTYIRRGPMADDQATLTVSSQSAGGDVDVDRDVARYAGARKVDVAGHPALLLAAVAGRDEPSLSWSPAPGQLAQVQGFGVSDDELQAAAAGRLPAGFTELQRNDAEAYPAPTPRRFTASTSPMRGPATAPGTPAVAIAAAWDRPLPAAEVAEPVRAHRAVRSVAGLDTTLSWIERPGLLVSVTGTSLGLDDVRRVAEGLRELSVDEVLARPSEQRVVVATGELAGRAYELRSFGSPSGPCLQLSYGWSGLTCASDPAAAVGDLTVSTGQGVAFGAVIPAATRVRLELGGDQAVETDAVGAPAGEGAAFFVVPVPVPDQARVSAVVAVGADGQVLRRTPVG